MDGNLINVTSEAYCNIKPAASQLCGKTIKTECIIFATILLYFKNICILPGGALVDTLGHN